MHIESQFSKKMPSALHPMHPVAAKTISGGLSVTLAGSPPARWIAPPPWLVGLFPPVGNTAPGEGIGISGEGREARSDAQRPRKVGNHCISLTNPSANCRARSVRCLAESRSRVPTLSGVPSRYCAVCCFRWCLRRFSRKCRDLHAH